MTIKKVMVEDAVGMVLGHDITKIIPGQYKGPAFRKGHIIKQEDIPHLKDIGKDHIFLIELTEGQVHEDEAVRRIAEAVAGDNISFGEPVEGRINLKAASAGLLKISREAVTAVNNIEHAVLSSLHSDRLVEAGDLIAAVKVVPLVVQSHTIKAVEDIGAKYPGMINVKPLRSLKLGVVITGSEVFYGRIEDKFAPVLTDKAVSYGASLIGITYQPDHKEAITGAVQEYVRQGADAIIITGGMSVDPDDLTPEAIISTGAKIITYGTPVLPGAMFMLAYLNNVAIMGMPACGMYSKNTVFDLIFPRILAGEKLSKKDIAAMGYGGLCLNCAKCTYPHCHFGKGGD